MKSSDRPSYQQKAKMLSLETYLTSAKKLRCVTYKDEFSIDSSSYNDLVLGMEKRMVACNSTPFANLDKGDIVVVTANKGKARFFYIGLIGERHGQTALWKENGGSHIWNYSFECTPITPICEETAEVKAIIKKTCEEHDIKCYLFNSRFCTIQREMIHLKALATGGMFLDI